MSKAINEMWYSEHCPYCDKYSQSNCKECPLGEHQYGCCNGLWYQMTISKTWGTWIKRAERVMEYIKENG